MRKYLKTSNTCQLLLVNSKIQTQAQSNNYNIRRKEDEIAENYQSPARKSRRRSWIQSSEPTRRYCASPIKLLKSKTSIKKKTGQFGVFSWATNPRVLAQMLATCQFWVRFYCILSRFTTGYYYRDTFFDIRPNFLSNRSYESLGMLTSDVFLVWFNLVW